MMTDIPTPRHRARGPQRTSPELQPAPKHAGPYVSEGRTFLNAVKSPGIDDIRDWFTLPAGIVR
jgi:hypothetical protein